MRSTYSLLLLLCSTTLSFAAPVLRRAEAGNIEAAEAAYYAKMLAGGHFDKGAVQLCLRLTLPDASNLEGARTPSIVELIDCSRRDLAQDRGSSTGTDQGDSNIYNVASSPTGTGDDGENQSHGSGSHTDGGQTDNTSTGTSSSASGVSGTDAGSSHDEGQSGAAGADDSGMDDDAGSSAASYDGGDDGDNGEATNASSNSDDLLHIKLDASVADPAGAVSKTGEALDGATGESTEGLLDAASFDDNDEEIPEGLLSGATSGVGSALDEASSNGANGSSDGPDLIDVTAEAQVPNGVDPETMEEDGGSIEVKLGGVVANHVGNIIQEAGDKSSQDSVGQDKPSLELDGAEGKDMSQSAAANASPDGIDCGEGTGDSLQICADVSADQA